MSPIQKTVCLIYLNHLVFKFFFSPSLTSSLPEVPLIVPSFFVLSYIWVGLLWHIKPIL